MKIIKNNKSILILTVMFIVASTFQLFLPVKSPTFIIILLIILSLALFSRAGIFGIYSLIFISLICFIESLLLGNRAYFLAIFVILLYSYSIGVSINITYYNLKDLCKTRQFNKESNYYKYIDPTWNEKDSDQFNSLNEVLQVYFSNENSIKKIRKARYLFESVEPQKLMDLRTHLKDEKWKIEKNFITELNPYVSAFNFLITLLVKPFNEYINDFVRSDLLSTFGIIFLILAGAVSFVITTIIIKYKRGKMINWTLEVVEEVLGGKKL